MTSIAVNESTSLFRRFTRLAHFRDGWHKGGLLLRSTHTWKDSNDLRALELYRGLDSDKEVRAICMTTSTVTYFHWSVYASAEDGICVKIFQEALRNTLRHESTLEFKPVRYISLQQLREGKLKRKDLAWVKRTAYRGEREHRVVAVTKRDAPLIVVRLEPTDIKEIVVNPFVDAEKYEALQRSIRALPGLKDVKVTRSGIQYSNVWQSKLGEIV